MRAADTVAPDIARRPAAVLGSPWAAGQLEHIALEDLYGGAAPWPMSRTAAMAIPAIARARTLLTSSVARCPVVALRAGEPVDPQPTWTYRTDGPVPPQARMLWTVDDLIFAGWSLWAVTRDTDGHLLDGYRIPPAYWSMDADGAIFVNGEQPRPDSIKLIGGPHEGILNFGTVPLRTAGNVEAAAARYAMNPAPVTELHETSEYALSDDEKAELKAEWSAARLDPFGAVAFTNNAVEMRIHGVVPEALMEAGRNASAVDCARMVGIPAAMIDATVAASSLTYETVDGRNGQFLDYGVTAYADAIGSWLSMDDVVPRGQRVAIDVSGLTGLAPVPTGAPIED